jgi:Na+/melibiose symporter-like transporter
MESKKGGFGSYLPLTFLIGFGFFTVGLMDPLYDSYVQIFLAKYIPLKSVIGIIMSVDNILALFLIPAVSIWSDGTRSPIGRRMPWIVILLPLSALCFAASRTPPRLRSRRSSRFSSCSTCSSSPPADQSLP